MFVIKFKTINDVIENTEFQCDPKRIELRPESEIAIVSSSMTLLSVILNGASDVFDGYRSHCRRFVSQKLVLTLCSFCLVSAACRDRRP
ncbi:hypothetical protein EVAR_82764_1 [Eumeta japonica]|uniref:Uncharacterized protein n=1 Tax=Eumeta variegata TaxID=151549 RepID=A0A4C1UP43_EUMVA|nr:hypothetical protein EVAR_82764_1 [Eumeta japonica]